MKKIKFDKLVILELDPKEEKIDANVNWFKCIYREWKLYELVDKLTVAKAKEIEAKYETIVNEQWQKVYSPEDIEKIQAEVAEYKVEEEIILYIDKTNVIEEIEQFLNS